MSALPSDRAQAALLRALRPWGPFAVEAARTTPWMSATFEGARHRIALRLQGGDAAARAAALRAGLAEAELPIRGGFVADVTVTEKAGAGDAALLAIEALTIDDPVAAAIRPGARPGG